MRIKCGNCRHSHESVEAVRECYGNDSRMLADTTSGATLRERAEERKSHATKNTMGGSSSGRMATEKMERYVRNLAREREMTPETAADALKRIGDGRLTFDYARKFIDNYKDTPRRADRRETAPTAMKQDGMYRNPDTGEIYKVQWNKAQGDGRRLYAKRLVLSGVPKGEDSERHNITPGTPLLDGTAKVTFTYAGSCSRVGLRPEMRMTADEAREFGALYGTCVRCGRTLTLEESIERSMGSVCASREGWL